MSPRAYRLGQRQVAADRTRARIIEASRELLSAEAGVPGFTIDAVAKQAGVARMTVYYQYSSKRGLLEALFDDLATRSLVPRLMPALQSSESEPLVALKGVVEAFAGFWAAERLVLRRVRSLAALDPDVEESVRARDERRRQILHRLLARLGPARPSPAPQAEVVDVLHTLTSFETFDTLAGASRPVDATTAWILHLAWLSLGLPTDPPRPSDSSL